MTLGADSDSSTKTLVETLPLAFASSSELEKAGIRVTRAEFSRIMGCSKQAVTDWVKSGRITVGCDGRFDPRAAVSQLLRTGDPARLRLRVLEPLAKELATKECLIADLRRDLAEAREEAGFERAAAAGLLCGQEALLVRLADEWESLKADDGRTAVDLIAAWLDAAAQAGGDPGLCINTENAAQTEDGQGQRQ